MTTNTPGGGKSLIHHKDYLLVTVAPQAKDFEIEGNELYYKAWFGSPDIGHMKKLPPGSWQLIGLAAEITEEQKKEIVGLMEHHDGFYGYPSFDGIIDFFLDPQLSFISLLRSHNLNAYQVVILKLIQP